MTDTHRHGQIDRQGDTQTEREREREAVKPRHAPTYTPEHIWTDAVIVDHCADSIVGPGSRVSVPCLEVR